ncbi:MAG: DUF1598 domain-containing protein [Planctomycetaceae bacterium]|nr:DUF1598 domain-containing protein [Planctomycetaceae bacterium]
MRNLFTLLAAVCLLSPVTLSYDSDALRSAGNGIDIDPQGRVLPLDPAKSDVLGKMMQDVLEPPPENLDRKVARRAISLKNWDAQIREIVEQNDFLPDSIRYFGGLTSIEYIVAVPEDNDLLLIGPGEGWRADAEGNVVGNQTGLPILLFEDFLTALRQWNQPHAGQAMTCSFEPTPEVQANLARLHRQFANINDSNADAYAAALEDAYGDVPIAIAGISDASRFARILVAADFKMKRIALGLEPSQIRDVPSYVSLISVNRPGISPQFRLISEYAATTHDSRKLTWRLGDVKVRVSSPTTGTMDRAAMTWSRNLEENYDTLARIQPVFGELRNTMTLALAAALIHQENLLHRSNCELSILLDESNLKLVEYPAPKWVPYGSVQSRNGFLTIVASGGIEINPHTALRNNVRLDSRIDSERARLIQFADGK